LQYGLEVNIMQVLHCSSYKMFTLCSISGGHLHLMTIEKIKRMLQTSGLLLAFALTSRASLLKIFSEASVFSRCRFNHFATSCRLLYFEYPELEPDVEGGPC
jgi:hypothetical protein